MADFLRWLDERDISFVLLTTDPIGPGRAPSRRPSTPTGSVRRDAATAQQGDDISTVRAVAIDHKAVLRVTGSTPTQSTN
ncbi:hypothetical protein [Streptomyces sp. enrichment culture]|uniref:hypothetical protein n=1 Tax=Streptomyces sp. enrichment culture TaxID=1795815 RepID=UPI003F57216C